MKRFCLMLTLISNLVCYNTYSQNFTREQTLEYINREFSKFDGLTHKQYDSYEKSTSNNIINSQMIEYNLTTKTYSIKTKKISIKNGKRVEMNLTWSNIDLKKQFEIKFYEDSSTEDSYLSVFFLKFNESSIIFSAENATLNSPLKSNTDNVHIQFAKTENQKQRLINAIKHLSDLDKKESKPDPFDN